jgi:RNA 2',3'-cyclic 3'-phosphodiesterase
VSASDQTRIRSFAALALEDHVRVALADLQRQLAPRLAGIRFVRPEGSHLTLRFLGDASAAQLERLRPLLAEAAAACAPGEARVAEVGTFPERGCPRVLWLGLAVPPQVLELQQACERAARQLGFTPETRPFRPHLTLGRWRDRAPHPELPAVDLGTTRLETLVLYESELCRDGAAYTALARFALGRGAGAA